MKSYIASIGLMIMLSGIAFAGPHGEGVGHGNARVGSVTRGVPPGLQSKGLPRGLRMQNKTPYGWSQGRKVGWTRNHVGTGHINHRHVNRVNRTL
jgi:hypothetical protein